MERIAGEEWTKRLKLVAECSTAGETHLDFRRYESYVDKESVEFELDENVYESIVHISLFGYSRLSILSAK